MLAKPPGLCVLGPVHSPIFERRSLRRCFRWSGSFFTASFGRNSSSPKAAGVEQQLSVLEWVPGTLGSGPVQQIPGRAALLLMGIETLFTGQHQQIWWDQFFCLSVMRSYSGAAIKYLETTAKPRKFPVRQMQDWNTEVWSMMETPKLCFSSVH